MINYPALSIPVHHQVLNHNSLQPDALEAKMDLPKWLKTSRFIWYWETFDQFSVWVIDLASAHRNGCGLGSKVHDSLVFCGATLVDDWKFSFLGSFWHKQVL